MEPPFEQGGFSYIWLNTVKEEVASEDHKSVTETRSIQTKSGELSEILPLAPSTLPYDAEGYKGTLYLDTASIRTEVDGYRTSSYTVTDSRSYSGLAANDPTLVPQTVTKNGVTLRLTGVTWAGNGGEPDSLIPASYTAAATYAGTGSSKSATGYTTSMTYTGEVSKGGIEKVIYEVSYLGTAVPQNNPLPPAIAAVCAALAVMAALACVLVCRPNVLIYGQDPGSYEKVLLSGQRITRRKTAVVLPWLEYSGDMFIRIKRQTAKRLYGRPIVVYGREVQSYIIDQRDGDFWIIVFKGGEENA